MKKQFIAFSALLITSTLYGITDNQIIQKLTNGRSKAFVQSPQTVPDFTLWNTAFEQAKVLIQKNSKNLVGSQDSILINALLRIEETNTDLINAAQVMHRLFDNKENMPQEKRTVILQLQKDICDRITASMKDVQSRLKNASFTLGNKKEAQNVLLNLALFIETAATKTKDSLLTMLA